MRHRFTYANVVSTLALVVAVGGGGTAFALSVADDSVGSRHIRDGSIRPVDVKPESLGSGRIHDGSLRGRDLRDGTLTGAQIANGSLLGAHLRAGTLTGAQIANGSLLGAHLRAGTLTGDQIANDSITGDDIDESTLDLPSSSGALVVANTPSGQTQLVAGANAMGSVELDAPSAGVAMVTIQAEFNASAGSRFASVTTTRNGQQVGYFDWDTGDADGLFDQRQTGFSVVPVAAGSHTFAFALTEERTSGAYSAYYGAQIAVQFYPDASAARAASKRLAPAPNR